MELQGIQSSKISICDDFLLSFHIELKFALKKSTYSYFYQNFEVFLVKIVINFINSVLYIYTNAVLIEMYK